MGAFLESFRSRGLIRLAPIALMASGLAACSSDIARFNDNALSSPYASPRPEGRGPAAPPHPGGPVAAQPLPPPPSRSDVTGTVARSGKRDWDWNGGKAIIVARGDTIASLAHKHHVPAS